jgi:ankyrin repeat protein
MKRHRYYLILLVFLSTLICGCSLVLPSHHRTEDYTPVFAAATSGDLPTVRTAVETDPALLKSREWDNATLLHDAVGNNQLRMVQYLLDKGADVSVVTSDGLTPLHMAAQNGNIEIIKVLLTHGARVNALDSKGWTPLDRAKKWGHPTAALFLAEHGGVEGGGAGAKSAVLCPGVFAIARWHLIAAV